MVMIGGMVQMAWFFLHDDGWVKNPHGLAIASGDVSLSKTCAMAAEELVGLPRRTRPCRPMPSAFWRGIVSGGTERLPKCCAIEDSSVDGARWKQVFGCFWRFLKKGRDRRSTFPSSKYSFLEILDMKKSFSIPFISKGESWLVTSGSAKVGRGLLQHALLHRKARLAVVASAFGDVSYLQCTSAAGSVMDFTWGFQYMEVPQARWMVFVRENPNLKWMI